MCIILDLQDHLMKMALRAQGPAGLLLLMLERLYQLDHVDLLAFRSIHTCGTNWLTPDCLQAEHDNYRWVR